jgi:hypothetical protein
MATLWVGSRKGLFRFDRAAAGWQQVGKPAFLAAPVTFVLDDPRDGALYVALSHGHFGCKLHRSDDRGATWVELPTPAFPKSDAPDAPALELIWSIVPAGADRPGALWLGTIPGGLFSSTDRGESWVLCSSLWNRPERSRWVGGGYDHAGIHSILVDPRDSAHVTLAVSTGGVWITRDGGDSWALGGQGLRADYMPPGQQHEPLFQDVHLLTAPACDPDRMWCQHHCGIFVSDDGGMTFRDSLDVAPSAFGFAVAAHPQNRDRAWFAPAVKDECRVPVDAKLVVTETQDGGIRFTARRNGLPQTDAYDLIYRHALVVDSSGAHLALGSTTGNLWASDDSGENWQQLSATLPPIAALAFAP